MKNKMRIFILNLLMLTFLNSFASTHTTSISDGILPNDDTTITQCDTASIAHIDTTIQSVHAISTKEVPAKFPGGDDAFEAFIAKNIQYPGIAKTHGIEGKVYVTLVLDETGKVENILLTNTLGGGCEEEVLRVLTHMPIWEPQKKGNVAVKTEMYLSFTFKL